MKLSKEITLFTMCGLAIMAILFSGLSVYSTFQNNNNEMTRLKSMIENERKIKLKDRVKGAYSVLDTASFYEPAQTTLSAMSFGENNQNHFMVFDTDGMVWVDPAHADQVGKIKLNETDADGNLYVRKMIQNALDKKEGFITFNEVPPHQTKPVSKIVYYKYFEKWNWVISTGLYMNDIEQVLSQKESQIRMETLSQVGIFLTLFLIAMMVSLKINNFLFSKRIVKPLEQVTRSAQKIAQGDFKTSIAVNSCEEINQLADSLQKIQISLEMAIKRAKSVKLPTKHPHLVQVKNPFPENPFSQDIKNIKAS